MIISHSRAARQDALHAYLHYAAIDPQLGNDFKFRLEDTLARIARNPKAYSIRFSDIRRCNLPRFKSRYVAYRIRGERILVLAIGHAKRIPFFDTRR